MTYCAIYMWVNIKMCNRNSFEYVYVRRKENNLLLES